MPNQDQVNKAKQKLLESNGRFLQEIGTLAGQLQQKSMNPQVKNLSGQIAQYVSQIQANQWEENQL